MKRNENGKSNRKLKWNKKNKFEILDYKYEDNRNMIKNMIPYE